MSFVYKHTNGKVFSCRSKLALVTLVTDALGAHNVPPNLMEIIDLHTKTISPTTPALAPGVPGRPPQARVAVKNPMPPDPSKLPPSFMHQGLGTWHEVDSRDLLPGVYHYNCSILRHGGKLVFVYRRQQSNGFSDVCGCELTGDFKVIPQSHFVFQPPRLKDVEHCEDPRLFAWNGRLCLSWTSWFGSWQGTQPTMRYAVLRDDYSVESCFTPRYRGNHGETCQKNWMFFSYGDRLHFVYYMKPHFVIELSPKGEVFTEHIHDWPGGWKMSDMRGGTPAVERDGEMWAIFHSHDPNMPCSYNPSLRRYIVGAYAFENKPPFRVTRYTPQPLWISSEKDRHLHWAPLCLFPCGLVADGDDWLISFGVNDLWSTIARVPHKQILERTVRV